MRKYGKFSFSPKIILSICTAGCVGLMILSFRYDGFLSPVRNTVYAVLAPMQKGINSVGTTISKKLDQFEDLNKLRDENKLLKEQLEALTAENNILQMDKYELDGLRELFELDQKYPDFQKVAARVIHKNSSNWYSEFKIDKGSKDGIKVNMNVIAPNGLVGIVTDVASNCSIVRSVIDDNFNVSGMFLKTSDACLVEGDLQLMDQGVIRVTNIPKDAKIKDGYEVVTSNISDKYLQGILIGYVSDITVDSSNMTKSAYLTPAVNFGDLDEVLIITQLKESYEELEY